MLLKNIDTAFRQDEERNIDHGIDILVRDGDIVEIGDDLSGEDAIDCSDTIALPGLINCHTHTPTLLARGWCDDKSLFPWLEATDQVLQRADRSQKRSAARLAAALMVETGTTTFNDMWNTYLVDEFETVGIRALVGSTLAEFDDADSSDVRAGLETNATFIEEYRPHPTIHPTVPVHSVYRATERLLQRAHELAATHNVPFHIHVSETRQENEDCIAEYGLTPTGLLEELDVLDQQAVLAHAVQLTDDDRTTIADSDAGIAHCATSNLKLGSGIADIPSLEGVSVGIGTDGAASNNSLNPVREGRTAALVHKRTDPSAITAQRILDMLTREGAASLNMDGEIGSLEQGKRADIVLIDKQDPTLHPHLGDTGLLSNLLYSFHGRVETTIVNGEIVVENGTVTAEIEPAVDAVDAFCRAVADQ